MIKVPFITDLFLPSWFHFELTSACNLSCPFCWRYRQPSGEDAFRHASDEIVESWLDMLHPGLEMVHPGGGGEALLHPRFGEFIQKTLEFQQRHRKKKPGIQIITNGNLIGKWPILLQAFELGRIQMLVSMESADDERYKLFRVGGDLHCVKANLLAIRQAREKGKNFHPCTEVIITSILTRHNVEDVPGLIDFALHVGVDKILFRHLEATTDSPEKFKPEDGILTSSQIDGMKNLRENAAQLGLVIDCFAFPDIEETSSHKKRWIPCEQIFRSIRFYPDGEVSYCPVMSQKGCVGNIFRNNLSEIWNSQQLKTSRKRILSGRPAPICDACVYRDTVYKYAAILRRKYWWKLF